MFKPSIIVHSGCERNVNDSVDNKPQRYIKIGLIRIARRMNDSIVGCTRNVVGMWRQAALSVRQEPHYSLSSRVWARGIVMATSAVNSALPLTPCRVASAVRIRYDTQVCSCSGTACLLVRWTVWARRGVGLRWAGRYRNADYIVGKKYPCWSVVIFALYGFIIPFTRIMAHFVQLCFSHVTLFEDAH
jgi:hypothetical protein